MLLITKKLPKNYLHADQIPLLDQLAVLFSVLHRTEKLPQRRPLDQQ